MFRPSLEPHRQTAGEIKAIQSNLQKLAVETCDLAGSEEGKTKNFDVRAKIAGAKAARAERGLQQIKENVRQAESINNSIKKVIRESKAASAAMSNALAQAGQVDGTIDSAEKTIEEAEGKISTASKESGKAESLKQQALGILAPYVNSGDERVVGMIASINGITPPEVEGRKGELQSARGDIVQARSTLAEARSQVNAWIQDLNKCAALPIADSAVSEARSAESLAAGMVEEINKLASTAEACAKREKEDEKDSEGENGDDDSGDDGTGDGQDEPGQEPIDWGTIDDLVNQHEQEGEPGESGPGALGGGAVQPQSPEYGGKEPEPEPKDEPPPYPQTYPPHYPYPPEGYPPGGETFEPPSWTELVPPGGHGSGQSSTQRGTKKCPTGCHVRPDGKGCHCPESGER